MSTRLAKQIIYAAFYVLLWALVFGGLYTLVFHPGTVSCFDHRQDGGEQGVDCGSVCGNICAASIQPIAVLSVNAFASGANNTFLAKIANPNADYVAQSFDYTFNVYDSSGTILQTYPGQSFLYPSQVRYLVLANQSVPSGVTSADLAISNANWVTSSSIGVGPQIVVQNVSTIINSSTPAIALASGQLVNNDTASIGAVLIVAIFKDSNGNPVGASQTELDGIAPGQTESFSVSYPALANINPVMTEVAAYAVR